MKKVLLVLVLIMAVLAVNAQAAKTTITKEKPIRAVVMTADILPAITDNIAKDFAGYTVKEAASIKVKDVVTYEVVVNKGTTMETLVYDKDGKFLKKLPPVVMKK